MKFSCYLLLVVTFLISGISKSFAQGDRCATIQPFCAGDSRLVFPNSNAANNDFASAEVGPDYECLDRQPYPAWYFFKVGEAGSLIFDIIQSENSDGSGTLFDVDFIVWGPFQDGDDYCSPASLSAQNKIDCSYLDYAIERMRIPNAQVDDIYIVLITNFVGSPGYISLQQINTGSGGSTDCSIVGSALGPDQRICGNEPVELDATNAQASEYSWALYNETTNEFEPLPGETNSTLTVAETGNYQVTVKSDFFGSEESDQVLIEFFETPVANAPDPITGCQENGEVVYDLTEARMKIIGLQGGLFNVDFYLNEAAYQSGTPIQNPENFQNDVSSVMAQLINQGSGCGSQLIQIPLEKASPPSLEWNEITPVCIDQSAAFISRVSLGTDLGPDYRYQWSIDNDPDGDGIQNPILDLDAFPAQRNISLTVTHRKTGCATEFTTEIMAFSPPQSVEVEITGNDFMEGGYRITATPRGAIGNEAVYQYSLNEGPWQLNPTFSGVSGGTHRVSAREINGCGSATSEPFRLIGYPRFFTPNNDGYNDSWNIITGAGISISKVIIYDRFGKLIKQINPTGAGWDGTFNNQEMPSDDYWFVVDFMDDTIGEFQQFKGHFTLKR